MQEETQERVDLSFFMLTRSFEYNVITTIPSSLMEILNPKNPIIASDINSMFSYCINLQHIPSLNINTKFCEDFGHMFSCNKKLRYVDLSWLDTSHATYMADMFYSCNMLEYVNFTNLDTSKVTSMAKMFYDCNTLEYVNGIIDMSSCEDAADMFGHCDNLKFVKLANVSDNIDLDSLGCDISKIQLV